MEKARVCLEKLDLSAGVMRGLEEYAERRVEENRLELEAAEGTIETGRLQGRIMELREFLGAIRRKKSGGLYE